MEELRQFRRFTVLFSLLLMGMGAAVALCWGRAAAEGVLLGGMGGIIPFWFLSFRMEKLARAGRDALRTLRPPWTLARLCVYAMALVWALRLDRTSLRGLYGALAGLFIVQMVQIVRVLIREKQPNSGEE